MSVLSDQEIRLAIEARSLDIAPLDLKDIQPSSVDLHLGSVFRKLSRSLDGLIDARNPGATLTTTQVVTGDEPFILRPRAFVLGTTIEIVRLSATILGRLDGKSTLGRVGLVVHATAGFVDPGWIGQLTLEMSNWADEPIALYPGMKICQISFERMEMPAKRPYGSTGLGSKYQRQRGPTGAKT